MTYFIKYLVNRALYIYIDYIAMAIDPYMAVAVAEHSLVEAARRLSLRYFERQSLEEPAAARGLWTA